MSGYKRVSFYELCRLCASSNQKEKTHIFLEDGQKLQLQSKIQTCLSLTVNENDCLPKVVCVTCLKQLETCYKFREECGLSESMLSAYFKNFRDTEDFKQSGKVYIKDIKSQVSSNAASAVSVSSNSVSISSVNSQISVKSNQNQLEVPIYTLQLPTIVTNPNIAKTDTTKSDIKLSQSSTQVTYNLNLLNTTALKSTIQGIPKELLSNVLVNSSGEVINISNFTDLDSVLTQANAVKHKANKPKKSTKEQNVKQNAPDENVVKIDLTDENVESAKYDKRPHIKSTNIKQNYAPKVEKPPQNNNQTVVYPPSEYNNSFNTYESTEQLYNMSSVQQNTSVMQPSTVDTGQLSAIAQENTFASMPHEENIKSPEPKKNEPLPKPHTCEICRKTFKRREHLYQHMKLHTGFRPYICTTCNKAFMRKEHLLRHNTLHSGQKNYACDVCNKSFSRNDNLLKHKKTHEKQASFTCEFCQKIFVMRHYYEAHKATHHGEKSFSPNMWGSVKS